MDVGVIRTDLSCINLQGFFHDFILTLIWFINCILALNPNLCFQCVTYFSTINNLSKNIILFCNAMQNILSTMFL